MIYAYTYTYVFIYREMFRCTYLLIRHAVGLHRQPLLLPLLICALEVKKKLWPLTLLPNRAPYQEDDAYRELPRAEDWCITQTFTYHSMVHPPVSGICNHKHYRNCISVDRNSSLGLSLLFSEPIMGAIQEKPIFLSHAVKSAWNAKQFPDK